MAKITRKTAYIFAENAASTDVEQFASKQQTGEPNYTADPAIIQALAAWGVGWSDALNPTNNSQWKQDRNAVDLVATYQIAYILQQGIPEWDSGTTYYTNSVVQYDGVFYISLVDDNINQTPPTGSNSYWRNMSAVPTQTILTSGSGTYTPPAGCISINVRLVGGGGGATGAGGSTTFGGFTAAGGAAGNGTGAGGAASGGNLNLSGAAGSSVDGQGGSSFFGGAGTSAASAAANSGSGANGGGSGGYVEGSVASPGSINYAVGGGGSGTQAGGSGIIIIQEFYY